MYKLLKRTVSKMEGQDALTTDLYEGWSVFCDAWKMKNWNEWGVLMTSKKRQPRCANQLSQDEFQGRKQQHEV